MNSNNAGANVTHFDAGKPELEFTVKADRKHVENDDHDPENCDEDSDGDGAIPELNDQTSGGEFESESRGPREPIDPTHGETQAGINKSRRIRSKGTGDGHIGGDFSQGCHDRVNDGSDEDICNESAHGASICDGGTATDEETSSNCSTWRERKSVSVRDLGSMEHVTHQWQSFASVCSSASVSNRAWGWSPYWRHISHSRDHRRRAPATM